MKVDDDVLDCVGQAIKDHPNEVNSRRGGYTPLLWVCWKIHGEVTTPLIKKLIDYGADVNATEEDGRSTWNALHSLCRYHTLPTLADLIKYLLEKRVDINAKSPFGFNALHLACCYQTGTNLLGVVRLLLERGIDVNARTNHGFTALHFLCKNYSNNDLKQIIELMLKYNADITVVNNANWTALHFACRHYQNEDLIDIVRLFAERGPESNSLFKIQNIHKQNALECCLLNPGGQFHAIFDYIKSNTQLQFPQAWRTDSLVYILIIPLQIDIFTSRINL